MLDRRQLLTRLTAAAAGALVGCGDPDAPPGALILSPEGSGPFALAALDEARGLRRRACDFRGHGLAWHSAWPDRAVLIARHPGRVGLALTLPDLRPLAQLTPGPGRDFSGHACFSADGQRLLTAELDAQTGAGWIGLHDPATLRPLGAYPSHGVGPHALACLPDGGLAVAHGGLRPGPDGAPLNPGAPESDLACLDAETGALRARIRWPDPAASVRHLAVARDGRIALAAQRLAPPEGAPQEGAPPLAGVYTPGAGLRLLEAPPAALAGLRDYLGDVALCPATGVAAFSSPRGDRIAFWHLDGAFLGVHALADACGLGLSADGGAFLVSSAHGQIRRLDGATLTEDRAARLDAPALRFDNHLLTVTP